MKKSLIKAIGVGTLGFMASQMTLADTIDPASFTASLEVGESVTITKTVTVAESTSTAILDVMFLIDTSGSMGAEIDAAKAAAADILTGLAGFGDVASGVGFYSEPGSEGVLHDLTTDTTTGIADIGSIYLGLGGYGGDFPEEGIHAVEEAADDASWRPGSTRLIIALGDATFKDSDGSTLASAKSALDDSGATFIGIDFGYMTHTSGISAAELSDHSGGSIVASSGLSTEDLVDDIMDGVTAALAEYVEVTVDDLGTAAPGVSVSVACTSADTGYCDGAVAKGSFDRSVERTFTYDVTFTGEEVGTHAFTVDALVDGGVVATEVDTITVSDSVSVPEPGTLSLLGLGLLGLASTRRFARKA